MTETLLDAQIIVIKLMKSRKMSATQAASFFGLPVAYVDKIKSRGEVPKYALDRVFEYGKEYQL